MKHPYAAAVLALCFATPALAQNQYENLAPFESVCPRVLVFDVNKTSNVTGPVQKNAQEALAAALSNGGVPVACPGALELRVEVNFARPIGDAMGYSAYLSAITQNAALGGRSLRNVSLWSTSYSDFGRRWTEYENPYSPGYVGLTETLKLASQSFTRDWRYAHEQATPATASLQAAAPGSDALTGLDPALANLLRSFLGYGTPNGVAIYVGSLPPGETLKLPLPAGGHLVGSVATGFGYRAQATVPLDPERASTFYRENLTAAGWKPLDNSWGFFAAQADPFQSLQGPDGVGGISFYANPSATGSSVVNFDVTPRGTISGGPEFPRLRLTAPKGDQVMNQGNGRSFALAYSSLFLVSTLDAAGVSKHYSTQLAQAGWQAVSSSTEGGNHLSVWRYRDAAGRDWAATLLVAKETEAGFGGRPVLLAVMRG